MAYVDHAFSISDEDMMMDGSHADSNRGPIKEIALAVSLLVFGTLGIVLGIFMAINKVGGDTAHGISFRDSFSPLMSYNYSLPLFSLCL